ncbi:MAG: hypothetical protein JRL30_04040 [Deltaproteobacteria bacterium]|nr:hypothetical protein [Deltaproteobacteria bacterium]
MRHGKESVSAAFLLFLFSFLFFHVLRIPVPLNVDTYLYARAIGSFDGPVIHFGYYIIGSLCHFLLGPMGVTPLQSLGYMSQFFGGVSVAGIYMFTFLLTKDRVHSFLTACILMFSGAFWLFSIHGEVYVPQLAFVLLSLICLLKIRPLLSSIFILIAVSITPTSLLALVPLCYVMYMTRLNTKGFIYFTTPILLAFILMISWDGPRVIRTFADAIHSPEVFFEKFSYIGMFRGVAYDLIKAYGRSFNLICFFAIFGLVAMYKKEPRLRGLMLAFLLPFFAYFLNLGLFSDDHLIISFIAVSFLGSYGILRLLDMANAHGAIRVLFIALLLLSYLSMSFEFSIDRQRIYARELKRVIHAVSAEYPQNGIMLSDYNFGVSFESITGEETSNDLFAGSPSGFLNQDGISEKEASERLNKKFWIAFACLPAFASRPEFASLMDERPVYFVDRIDWPIGFVQVFKTLLINMGFEKPTKQNQRRKNIKAYLAYQLNADISIKKCIDSPLHPVYVMKPVRRTEGGPPI